MQSLGCFKMPVLTVHQTISWNHLKTDDIFQNKPQFKQYDTMSKVYVCLDTLHIVEGFATFPVGSGR